jgi:response regulator of citrate/malate metabolism
MNPANIILIDDDKVFNFINKSIIMKAGFESKITCFTEAEKALAMLDEFFETAEAENQSLIFLDINMPDMDGWEFLAEYSKFPQEKIKNSDVIILSSSIDINDIEKSKTIPAVADFISKPLTIDKLQSIETNVVKK